MDNNKHIEVISKAGIPLTATGATLLFTTENGTRRFVVLAVNIEITTANTVTIAGTLSVGQTSSAYADILAAAALTGLTSANKMAINMGSSLASGQASIAPNTGIYTNVSVASTATAHVARIDVIGYYV